jgi:hypothetical protein
MSLSDASLKALNDFLEDKSYIEGSVNLEFSDSGRQTSKCGFVIV